MIVGWDGAVLLEDVGVAAGGREAAEGGRPAGDGAVEEGEGLSEGFYLCIGFFVRDGYVLRMSGQ